ncbi:archaetidylserine decarboxylase [Calditerricola satsumensis]|uniref:Phosphatidylserine decarboxylase proenzyme n=2 Tax=Calditerricola satsumensis TaxID=373054 RepID=A0A8J3BAQ2_9BACI|nr:hypothetical protein GCM10007043_22140 [Calditerricola satsumensis]
MGRRKLVAKDRVMLWCLRAVPKRSVSRLAGYLAASPMSRVLIPRFARTYGVNVDEAERPLEAYESLADFFTRRLKPGARPVAPGKDVVVSPVDGRVSQAGSIAEGTLLQAKGVTYRVRELLGSAEKAAAYEGGAFVTLYLSPRDYHRIHMPVSGWITEYCYVPGTLFPVNPFGVRCVDGLFAKNERLITYIRTDWGEVAVVKVGATMVGSVCVTYDETVRTNVRRGKLTCRVLEVPHYAEKGEELGYFTFGSTVIVLFPRGTVRLRDDLCPGQAVRMGEPIGRVTGM